MQVMEKLLADVLVENKWYINHHPDDFAWIGTDVYGADGDGDRLYPYHMVSSIEQAMQVKDELLNKYPIVIIRDNATREETVYKNEGVNSFVSLRLYFSFDYITTHLKIVQYL